jgi:hypothetical protein
MLCTFVKLGESGLETLLALSELGAKEFTY